MKTRRGASIGAYGVVIGLLTIGASVAVSQSGDQVRGITARVAGSVNAVDGLISGNKGPGYQGLSLADQTVDEFDPVAQINARGFLDPEGDALSYSLSLSGGLQPEDFTVQQFPDGVVIDGTPGASGTLAVVATDPIGRTATAGPAQITVNPNQPPILFDAGASPIAAEANTALTGVPLGVLDDPEKDGILSVELTVSGPDPAADFFVGGVDPVVLGGTPTLAGEYQITMEATDQHGASATFGPFTVNVAPDDTSCNTLLQTGGDEGNGLYTIAPSGTPIQVYCDMTTNGGGWTRVAGLYEADPISAWDEGVQGDYDPTLASGKSFSLPNGFIPPHQQIGFGRNADPMYVDATVSGAVTYHTGEYDPAVTVTGISGHQYQLHRARDAHYGWHNPDDPALRVDGVGIWHDTLTFDETGARAFTWAYSPNYTFHTTYGLAGVGYAMNGTDLQHTLESFAWTVWVR